MYILIVMMVINNEGFITFLAIEIVTNSVFDWMIQDGLGFVETHLIL